MTTSSSSFLPHPTDPGTIIVTQVQWHININLLYMYMYGGKQNGGHLDWCLSFGHLFGDIVGTGVRKRTHWLS